MLQVNLSITIFKLMDEKKKNIYIYVFGKLLYPSFLHCIQYLNLTN